MRHRYEIGYIPWPLDRRGYKGPLSPGRNLECLTESERYLYLYAILRCQEWNDYCSYLTHEVTTDEVAAHFGYTLITLKERLDYLIIGLNYQQQLVTVHGFGLQGHEPQGAVAIGKMLNVTSTRPWQIRQHAFRALDCGLERQELADKVLQEPDHKIAKDILCSAPITTLGLSARAIYSLAHAGVETIGDVVTKVQLGTLLNVHNLGVKEVANIVATVRDHELVSRFFDL